MKKPVYVGVFLDEENRKKLLAAVAAKHPNVHAHHLTLAFGKAMSSSYELGKKVELHVSGVFEDGSGQAVSVHAHTLNGLLAEGQNPHITVSCAEGVAPKYSNELLSKAEKKELNLVLSGVLDYFPRTLS